MGTIALLILVGVEIGLMVWTFIAGKYPIKERSIVRICEWVIIILLFLTGIFEWGFRYTILFAVLTIQALVSVINLCRKKTKDKKVNIVGVIAKVIGCTLGYTMALIPAFIFPQYKQLPVTGIHEVATAKYTWVDENRVETFSDTGENRSVTIDCWYPEDMTEEAPLVIFSHGAFGFSGSNYSLFHELASEGYVVASIGHPYHAFFVEDASGKVTTVNMDFMNYVIEINNTDNDEEEFAATREWMKLRTEDANFILNKILEETQKSDCDAMFAMIDTEKIGIMGHSLGGATAAQMGRERTDIDAVVVLDGTILGDELDFSNGVTTLNDEPYPVPILDMYGEDHYTKALKYGEAYANFNTDAKALEGYAVVMEDAGHMNFTDLPLFSPFLASTLGTGSVNAGECIETTDQLILQFLNAYLKDGEKPVYNQFY